MNRETMPSQSLNFPCAPTALRSDPLPAQARLALSLMHRLQHGALLLKLPDGRSMQFGDGSAPIRLELKNWKLFGAAMRSGDIGFAECFIDGAWTTDDLPGLIELLIRNREPIESLIYGTWWGNLLYRAKHLFNRNSRNGSRKNIHAHYDIGNEFYKLWLDPSMTYSSALFSGDDAQTLEQAQLAKYRRLLGELQVQPEQHILEIGCGWGGFAEIAAREGNCRITGLTLSGEQLAFSNRRAQDAGLADQIDLRLQDYRDTTGEFDAIASIEMFEAVGEAYWPDYFQCIARRLKPGGRACIQTIVIADGLFERYRTGTDFIQQYIFPGGMLPSPSVFREQAEKYGLRVVKELAFGLDYARTLQEWRQAFKQKLLQVRQQGFDDRFLHTWEFYLAYCEAGFRANSIDVVQFTLEK
jgi:cyclopropane-fatty-acyl-phospholipid synthase